MIPIGEHTVMSLELAWAWVVYIFCMWMLVSIVLLGLWVIIRRGPSWVACDICHTAINIEDDRYPVKLPGGWVVVMDDAGHVWGLCCPQCHDAGHVEALTQFLNKE